MGLDNIPYQYPCRTQGTAVLITRKDQDGNTILDDDGSVLQMCDCQATQSAGGCPYLIALNRDLGDADGRVTGMFGTDCWYRGKWGNHLLQELGIYDEPHISFYGDNDDGSVKSAESCRKLADALTDEWKRRETKVVINDEDVSKEIQYAAWWARWAADECDGSRCWY